MNDLSNIGQLSGACHTFTLYGITKSKKNAYTPRKGGMFKNKELADELDELEKQVPGDVRDLCLEHPDMIFLFSSRSSRRDRDGLLASVLDVLVRCKVIVDDSIAHCNGFMTIVPAILQDEDSVVVSIYPR